MEKLLVEAFDIIETINEEIIEQIGGTDFYCNLEIRTNADEIEILFGRYCLWNSKLDDRSWDEETEDYGPLEPFVRQELNVLIDILKKIKV